MTKAPGYKSNPDHQVLIEPSPRRVKVVFAGATVVQSDNVLLVRETGHTPVYYFPRGDADMSLLSSTDHSTHCPFKGNARYFTVKTGDKSAKDAIWSYLDPYDEARALKDHLAFYWNKMDHWFEEDDEIFVHPRDPYKRVDVVASSRRVQVVLGGETAADTTRAHFLYETGLPTRYYIPEADVAMDLLRPSETSTMCPYKGTARYWSATIGENTFDDVVWSYPDPIPECPRMKDLMCFFNEHADAILVDGVAVEQVETPWSKP